MFDADNTWETPPVEKVIVPAVCCAVEDVTVITVGPSMLVMVVLAPKAPVPEVLVTVIPTNKPAVEAMPVIGVMYSPPTAGAPVDKIVPDVVAVDTEDLVVMFGLGF